MFQFELPQKIHIYHTNWNFPEIQDCQVVINLYNNTSNVIQFPRTFNFIYLDIWLIGKENLNINDQAIYSGMTNLSHTQYNKHGPLQSAIDERALVDKSHITPDDHPWLVFLDKSLLIEKPFKIPLILFRGLNLMILVEICLIWKFRNPKLIWNPVF